MSGPDFATRPKILSGHDLPLDRDVRVADNDLLPWQHFLDGLNQPDSVTPALAGALTTTQWPFFGIFWVTGATAALGSAKFGVDVYTAAGLWQVQYPTDRRNDYAIVQYRVDDRIHGYGEDRYAAAFSIANWYEYYVYLSRGWHRFECWTNGKNATSTNYVMVFSGLMLSRVGDPFVVPVSPDTLVSDPFTRANSAVSPGNAPTGQAWAEVQGNWGISNNQLYRTTNVDGDLASIEAGSSEMSVSAAISGGVANECGIVGRFIDANNFYMARPIAGGVELWVRSVGTWLPLSVMGNITNWVDGDVIGLVCDGSNIYATRNGFVLTGAPALSSGPMGTKAGVRAAGAGITGRWDNFLVMTP